MTIKWELRRSAWGFWAYRESRNTTEYSPEFRTLTELREWLAIR